MALPDVIKDLESAWTRIGIDVIADGRGLPADRPVIGGGQFGMSFDKKYNFWLPFFKAKLLLQNETGKCFKPTRSESEQFLSELGAIVAAHEGYAFMPAGNCFAIYGHRLDSTFKAAAEIAAIKAEYRPNVNYNGIDTWASRLGLIFRS
jgi:hypothetical protein